MDEVPEEFGVRQWSPSMVGTMSVLDRGDAPAQLVIERNLKAQAQRQADQTKEELDRITSRVNKTVAAFELNEEMMDENKAAYFVPDLLELEKIISDTIQKRRYQQQVMIFVVGFEEVTDQRLKLLNQINDFFGTYINSVDEEEFKPKKPEVDLEEVSVAVKDALDTASSATQKLSDINTEILSYVEKMTGGKAASKSKKKLEKALQQAKDDIMSLTDKLQGAQADIEDKEDQMTRLYKQIDLKSMEVMKYKNAAEQAKKKLDQISELQLEISERDEEIERLNKALDDSQLSLKQLENSKENSFARLKAANDEGENKNQTIEKLQRKIQALNVQLGDSWNDSQKQFESTLQQVNEEHRQELESIRETLQARIDELEEEALNQPKGWASDSEDERDLTKSLSRTSGYLDHGPEFEMTEVASNVTSLSQPREPGWDLDTLGDDREIKSGLSSRQPSSIRKQELQSRQSTDAAIKPTPPGTPKNLDPPKPKNINKVIEDDSSRNKTGTPKKAMRTKSNLEPVHEVPFEEKIPLEEEERWSKVPQEQLPSAFKQYRKEALFIVQGLQEKIKTNQEDNHKKIKQLRNHIQVKEEKWDKERNTLVHQVDAAREAEREAEKEADSAVAQLESFVKEHEETTKNAIKQEQKALKTLTPEQRAKYLGEFNPMEMVKPIKEEKDGEDELDRPLSASSHHSQQSLYEKFRAQLEQRKQEIVERRSRATSMHGSLLSAKSGSYRDQAPSRDSSAVLTPQGDIQFPDEEYEDPGEVLKSSAESSTRPHPQREQQSAAISHQDQMSQARLSTAGYQGRVSSHLVSRAPSVSESGVSMLETDEEGGYSADEEEAVAEALPRFIATATSAKLFDVDKLDMATSPVAYSTVSKSSRQSIESIADHPVVQDYLKTYQHITDFKENVMKLVYDKEFGAALEQLAEIKTLQFDRDSNVQSQVSHMTYNVETFLKEIISVFGTVMTTPEPEAAISSLMVSRADTGKSRMGGLGFQLQSAAEAIQEGVQEGLEREMTDMTFQSSERIKEIQENYDRLKQEASKQQMDYEDKLNNNTVMMMEMQNTIQDLQQELQALGGSKAMSSPSRVSTATANRDLQVEPTIIFSRSDSERNQRALKRGISAQKVSAEQYNEAVRAMEQYTVLPAKRLVHIVRKYSHHTEMKKIEDDVRRSNSIDQEVYTLLERMETLQSKRAQRWGEEMDNLTAERNRLAHLLMDTLTHLEQESGIFMIKPILSWKGRGFQPHYQSKLSSYQPPKRLLRPITPEERKGTPFTVVPAPTPANQGTKAGYRPGTRTSSGTPGGGDAHRLYTSGHIPNGGASLKGSAVQMVGEVPQPMWSMNTSIPTQGGEGTGTVGGGLTGRLNFMTTPRLLELDVNRLLIGQNTVSAATKALLSNDRLVNAANSSVRSYVTIARPSTHPPVPNLRPSRPNSSSEAEKGQTTPRSPPPQTSSSAGPHGRSRSEGALQMSQPLPPIKVPSNNNEEDDNRTGKDTGESNSQSRLHPSPPHTPPGSSLRHSPAIIDDDDDPRQSQNASPGHITKVSMRSASRSSEHNLKM
ncbi:interaptin-like isoform X9 [Lytechinus variegatus]|uniref:interaptin-like isoform X9 n=1 Tax=Lytechinus variegatus TaxID=7654 RepID=UPI001BB27A08|nr:interaptin-like isoform X9 [Lytechinus variegatus]